MRLSYLEMEGFRGARRRMRIDFAHGFTIVTGRNGTGKSTICDAIEFALRGTVDKYQVATEKGENFEQYMWWRGEGKPERQYVTVGFVGDEGEEWTVHRTPRHQPQLALQDEEVRTRLCIGEIAPEDALDLLVRTSIIRDESITSRSFDLSERDRYFFVHAAIGSDVLAKVERRAKSVRELLQAKKREATEEYANARAAATQLHAEMAQARVQVVQASDRQSAVETLVELTGSSNVDLTQLLIEARDAASDLRITVQALLMLSEGTRRIESTSSTAETQELRESASTVKAERDAAIVHVEDARRALNELPQAGKAATRIDLELENDLRILHEHGARLGLRNGHCPLCGLEQSVHDYEKALETLASEVAALAEQSLSRGKALAAADETLAVQEAAVRESKERYKSLERRLAELDDERNALLKELARYSIVTPDLPTAASMIEDQVNEKRDTLTRFDKSLAILEASLTVDRVVQLGVQIEEAEAYSAACAQELTMIDERLDHTKSLFHQIQRAVGEVVDQRLATLEPLFKDLYRRLQPHVDWHDVQYHMRGDVRHFLSLMVGDDLNPRFMFSSGQRRALGIAFLLAVFLSRPWSRLKTLMLDDPVQHVDDYRALHLVETLNAVKSAGYQIVCTVEDAALAELLCRRMATSDPEIGRLAELTYTAGEGCELLRSKWIPSTGTNVIKSA